MSPSGTWSFANCDELIGHLKARDWKLDFRRAHEKVADLGPLTAICHSVCIKFTAWCCSRIWRFVYLTQGEPGKFS
jgi:hypothetical protein